MVEYLPSKQMAGVRFPDFALFIGSVSNILHFYWPLAVANERLC
jgi:hypothetical protein